MIILIGKIPAGLWNFLYIMNLCLFPKGARDLCCHFCQHTSQDSLVHPNSAVNPKSQGMHIITIFTVMAQAIMIPTASNETKVHVSFWRCYLFRQSCLSAVSGQAIQPTI